MSSCFIGCRLTVLAHLFAGDFAVLLKAGMSVKQAIVYNVLSALMAYVGMLIGTAVGQYTHNVTSWIFAVTAGMFLYVALVDMVSRELSGHLLMSHRATPVWLWIVWMFFSVILRN